MVRGCRGLEARPADGVVVVDGWIAFRAAGRVAALCCALREALDAALDAKVGRGVLR